MEDQGKRNSSRGQTERDQIMEGEEAEDEACKTQNSELELKRKPLKEKLRLIYEKYLIVQKLKTYC